MTRRRQTRDPYTDDPRDPLELISRLLVGGSYRTPDTGGGGKDRLCSSEIAAAVGYMSDRLEGDLVIAVATRAERAQLARLSMSAYRRIARELRSQKTRPLQLSRGADRWRLRMVVYDATCELVWPERRRALKVMAKAAKMRLSNYCTVHRLATSVLQQTLNEGRDSFRHRLWGARRSA